MKNVQNQPIYCISEFLTLNYSYQHQPRKSLIGLALGFPTPLTSQLDFQQLRFRAEMYLPVFEKSKAFSLFIRVMLDPMTSEKRIVRHNKYNALIHIKETEEDQLKCINTLNKINHLIK